MGRIFKERSQKPFSVRAAATGFARPRFRCASKPTTGVFNNS